MKAIFYADLRDASSSGAQRLWALKQCNVEIVILDKQKYKSKFGHWAGYLAKVLKQPRLMLDSTRLEQDLIELCELESPDIIWFEWAKEIQPQVLRKLKQLTPRPFLISFQDDNPWGSRHSDKWMWKSYFKLVPEFDLHLAKRPSDIENLTVLGAKWCRLWKHGIYKPLFYPPLTQLDKKYPISFIGTCMDGRAELIKFLLEKGVPIHIFGSHWEKRSDLPKRFPSNFHPTVWGEKYADVIRQSQICLGLVSHSNKDEWTMRTYEVPGCAGLLLAEQTTAHSALFDDGIDAELFATPEQCLRILERLLSDPEHCTQMGILAYQKFKKNEWFIENSMKELLKALENYIIGLDSTQLLPSSL